MRLIVSYRGVILLIVVLILSGSSFERSDARRAPTFGEYETPTAEGSKGIRQGGQVDPGRWYVYRDADSPENHGEWSNWLPKEASQMIKLSLVDKANPMSGAHAIRVEVTFAFPGWCGIAVASQPDCWGETPVPSFDLRKAKRLVFSARGEKGDESIQVKVAITGDKPYGDSAKIPAATRWIALTKDWKQYDLPLKGYNLSRVITPFVFVTDMSHNDAPKITFYMDEIYFEMEGGK